MSSGTSIRRRSLATQKKSEKKSKINWEVAYGELGKEMGKGNQETHRRDVRNA